MDPCQQVVQHRLGRFGHRRASTQCTGVGTLHRVALVCAAYAFVIVLSWRSVRAAQRRYLEPSPPTPHPLHLVTTTPQSPRACLPAAPFGMQALLLCTGKVSIRRTSAAAAASSQVVCEREGCVLGHVQGHFRRDVVRADCRLVAFPGHLPRATTRGPPRGPTQGTAESQGGTGSCFFLRTLSCWRAMASAPVSRPQARLLTALP
jgi:hypothetical protein